MSALITYDRDKPAASRPECDALWNERWFRLNPAIWQAFSDLE
jgi:hypothetical protein